MEPAGSVALVVLLAGRAGAHVVSGDADAAAVEALQTAADRERLQVRSVALDVTDVASVAAFVELATGQPAPLHGLVCSAGIAPDASFLEMPHDLWDRVIDVNLSGTFRVAQRVAQELVAAGTGGSIVTLGSANGTTGAVDLSHYSSTKAGILGLTKSMARELGPHGIRVNCASAWGRDQHPLVLEPIHAGAGRTARRGAAVGAARRAGGHGGEHRVPPVRSQPVDHWPKLPDQWRLIDVLSGPARSTDDAPTLEGDMELDETAPTTPVGDRGRALMISMIGQETVDRITERNVIAPKWQRWTTEVLFGEVWGGDGLGLRDRSMITVAVLVSMSRPRELENHLRAALVNGVTTDELVEIVQHVGFYVGWPAVGAALSILERIVDEG